MVYEDFDAVISAVKARSVRRVMAVAAAEDPAVISSVIRLKEEGIADSILIGDAARIHELFRDKGQNPGDFHVVNAQDRARASELAVLTAKSGDANFIMKGMLDTRDLLLPLVNRANDMYTGRLMSHIALCKLPNYHKLIAVTDGGMVPHPSLAEKKEIAFNAISIFHTLGYHMPKIAMLAGVERVNARMPETVDAAALANLCKEGEIPGCLIEGPISYDVAMDVNIARHKGVLSDACGNFDVLVVPCLAAGNILVKSWTVSCGARLAGIVTGARVPVIVPSRGSSEDARFLSAVLAAMVSAEGGL